ncbi:acyl-CoA binding protein [Xylona heveae TC161]|uniref:Acyl-CoA binding protein n=1 Tax=Xylona heveae (strain CBS 132557 / TC161) TaxID=1328760 RepID=A0A165AKQ8_XYLHT|nr:acyl-CoA binding protein [Xylona heveae TC161]KZF20647.1 acyl-CoA binding protein [Xylona heveae TC161]
MSDSVDRVFVHALSTVKKIPRTGSARPPPAERLKLYGLYKQSMEGNVVGIMDRPAGDNDEERAERAKWDAWNQQHGLSKTEAKRRYISTLIDAMHKYASSTSEARELVSELEFVWDQIKSNAPSSSSSPPLQTNDVPVAQSLSGQEKSGLKILNPVSPGDDEGHELREYVEAKTVDISDIDSDEYENVTERDESGSFARRKFTDEMRRPHRDWRRQVEQALVKITAEIAALREQIESSHRRSVKKRPPLVAFVLWAMGTSIRHLLIDTIIVGVLFLWMRRRKDPRLEDALKVIFNVLREYARRLRYRKRR